MTYHVLARKWRPQTFSDLVGQTHVVKALTFALSHNQVHHAYLFTGTRGVGKTSIARIFAKSLNCEQNGVSANPCGECETCREIKAGKFVDLIEVDAASRTGVDETRELIDSVAYLPTKGRYKVYLIDEVHMFSKSSFNALLKTLEEPPEHVKFILATTDPDKLPITILSRCLQFNLKSLTQSQIRQHLANICEAESIRYDNEALALLANAGDGSMRDTLSMTDQAIAYGQGELHMAAVTEILGTIQPADIEAILFAIATNNPNQLSAALHRLDDYEVDARAFLIEIMQRLQRMAWAKEGIVENLSPALQSTVADIPKPLLHLWYDIAEKALPNLAVSGEPRQAVEMTLLRMLAFIPNDWVPRHRTVLEESLSAPATSQVQRGESQLNSQTETAPASVPSSVQNAVVAETTENTSGAVNETAPHVEGNDGFAEHLQATPVAQADDLAAAEAQFSGDSVSEPEVIESTEAAHLAVEQASTNNSAQSQTDASAPVIEPSVQPVPPVQPVQPVQPIKMAQTPPTLTDDTPVQAQVREENSNNANNAPADVAPVAPPTTTEHSAWHLAQEENNAPPPSMDEINAMMQRGSDISAPEESTIASHNFFELADTPPTNVGSNPVEALTAVAATDTAKPVDDDVPPWQSSETDESTTTTTETANHNNVGVAHAVPHVVEATPVITEVHTGETAVVTTDIAADITTDATTANIAADIAADIAAEIAPDSSAHSATTAVESTPTLSQNSQTATISPMNSIDTMSVDTGAEPTTEAVVEHTENNRVMPSIAADAGTALADFQWLAVVNQLGLSDYTLHFVSLGIVRVAAAEGFVEAVLDLPPTNAVMETEDSMTELQIALQQYLQQPVKVSVNLTALNEATPAEIAQQQQAQHQADLLTQFQQQPIVQRLVQTFDGHIIEKTIKPTT